MFKRTNNDTPFQSGWICKVKLNDVRELDKLMSKAQYEKHCAESKH